MYVHERSLALPKEGRIKAVLLQAPEYREKNRARRRRRSTRAVAVAVAEKQGRENLERESRERESRERI